jgi:hypothetical protein
MARLGEAVGAIALLPNWASQVGGLMGLHLAKAHRNVTGAEDHRSACDVLNAEGYEFRHGSYTSPRHRRLGHSNEAVCKPRYQAAGAVLT